MTALIRGTLTAVLGAIPLLAADLPPWPTYAWPRSTPEEQGLDSATLEAGHRYIETECPTRESFLVVRNGYLVFERYYRGNTATRANHVMSISKSWLAALTGIALEKGYLRSLDQRVIEWFPEYDRAGLDPRKRDITLRHLLSMCAGFDWVENGPVNGQWIRSSDWMRFTFELPLAHPPGEAFTYNSGLTHLLSGVLTKATRLSTQDFAIRHLFTPLGIINFRWDRDPKGYYVGGWRMYFTAPDLAKLGYLYLHKGRWGAQQVVTPEWVEESTKLRWNNDLMVNAGDYAYLWWRRTFAGYESFFASGFGGQQVHVIPALDLVVVSTAKDLQDSRDLHIQVFNLLNRYVIPALRFGGPSIARAVNAAGPDAALSPDSFVAIYGTGLAYGLQSWDAALQAGASLPRSMFSSRVRIHGRDCYLSYVSPSQVNALLPPDIEPGPATLATSTLEGTASMDVTIERVAPALFTYAADGKTYAAAVDRADDRFELYAAGLGPTSPAHPVGQVLRESFPLANRDSLAVFAGGLPATLEYAGMIAPGLFQVNVLLPPGLPEGDVPVVIEVAGQRSPAGVLLHR